MNNMKVVAYLKQHRVTVSMLMCSLAQGIVAWIELHSLTLSTIYIYYYVFHDLIVNFLIPLYVNIYLVYSLFFINFGGLSSFLTYLLTCGAVVLVLEY